MERVDGVGEVPFFLAEWVFGARVLPSGFGEDHGLLGSKLFPAVLF